MTSHFLEITSAFLKDYILFILIIRIIKPTITQFVQFQIDKNLYLKKLLNILILIQVEKPIHERYINRPIDVYIVTTLEKNKNRKD